MPKVTLLIEDEDVEIEVPHAGRFGVYMREVEAAANAIFKIARDKKLRGLRDSALLASLVTALDHYLLPVLVAAINAAVKEKGGKPSDYADTVLSLDLASAYPFAMGMLKVVRENFVRNLTTACDRILDDWKAINAYFFPEHDVLYVDHVKSSGSDFHRGGQQVLFLTFAAAPRLKKFVKMFDVSKHDLGSIDDHKVEALKLVYKPADLERDCKTVGDWAAILKLYKRIPDGKAKGDLKEIYNSAKATGSLVNLLNNLGGWKLPCYRIMPRNPGSTIEDSAIGTSYGYLEFLEPLCAEPDNLELYFKQLGVLAAAAYVFGYTDIHHDNVIVRPAGPHLIDLEMAYLGVMSHYADTSISVNESGVRDDHYDIDHTGPTAKIKIRSTYHPAVSALAADDAGHVEIIEKVFVKNQASPMAAGFQAAMKLIAANPDEKFATWLGSLRKTVVRLIPETTEFLLDTLRSLHDASSRSEGAEGVRIAKAGDVALCCAEGDWSTTSVPEAGALAQHKKWVKKLTELAKGYETKRENLDKYKVKWTFSTGTLTEKEKHAILSRTSVCAAAPWFCVWASGVIADDFVRGDIPSYYTRFDSKDVLDSTGKVVDVGRLSECGQELELLEKLFGWQCGKTFLPESLFDLTFAHLTSLADKSEVYFQYFAGKSPK